MMSEPERLEGQTGTLDGRVHVQSIVNDPRTAANSSATLDLPARSAALRIGEPERFENRMDASNACKHAQSVESDSRRLENKVERVRRPKNG